MACSFWSTRAIWTWDAISMEGKEEDALRCAAMSSGVGGWPVEWWATRRGRSVGELTKDSIKIEGNSARSVAVRVPDTFPYAVRPIIAFRGWDVGEKRKRTLGSFSLVQVKEERRDGRERERERKRLTMHRVTHLMEDRLDFLEAQERRAFSYGRLLKVAVEHADGQLELSLPIATLYSLDLQRRVPQPIGRQALPLARLEPLQIALEIIVVHPARAPDGVVGCVPALARTVEEVAVDVPDRLAWGGGRSLGNDLELADGGVPGLAGQGGGRGKGDAVEGFEEGGEAGEDGAEGEVRGERCEG
jgi:hypothetical protein